MEKGDYEMKIKDIYRNGGKTIRKKKNTYLNHLSNCWLVTLCVFAIVKEAVGHFPVGPRLPLGLKNGSDVPGIFATILPCQSVW